MIDYLTILRAVYSGLSQRQAAATHRVSRNTIALLIRQAKAQGWHTLEDLQHVDEATIRGVFSDTTMLTRDQAFQMPDYELIHRELAKPHVTLKLLWEEYVDECKASGHGYYMETKFRRYYHKFARIHKATIRLDHKPALSLEIDWAGTKIAYYDIDRASMAEASLFVAVLPCSRLIYAEAFRDEKQVHWIAGHIHAFEYFGGVPKTLIPDNLKTGVHSPDFYSPDLNKTYLEMANHYGTVILPARVRKPKDKPSVENAVLIASRRILARLRNHQILSFSDLQDKIRRALEEVNTADFSGEEVSRWDAFLSDEKEYLLPLPFSPYELAHWRQAKVQTNCHVVYERKFYSVPFEYIGETVDIRTTSETIECFYRHQRIASHRLCSGSSDYATIPNHLPPDKLFFCGLGSRAVSLLGSIHRLFNPSNH